MKKKMMQEELLEQSVKRVLIVEDDAICRKVLQEQLQGLGYQVDSVNEATFAIQKLQENLYNLVVTDLRLPDESGETVIHAARQYELNQGTPIIVLSAQITQTDFKKYLELGADGVLIKGDGLKALIKKIKECESVPCYKRKFRFQISALWQELGSQPAILNEEMAIDNFIKTFQALLYKSLYILKEYQQWSEFEKLKKTNNLN